MKLGIRGYVEGRFMKNLLLTCILIGSIIFIAGCIGDEKTDAGTPASSQITQESDDQTPDLILKPSDVPGLTLGSYVFRAVQKNALYTSDDSWTDTKEYKDALPIGYRNVGETSSWSDQSGRALTIMLLKYDSYIDTASTDNYAADAADRYEKELEKGILSTGYERDWGDPHVGDYSFYVATTDPNTSIQTTKITFACNNYVAVVFFTDEEGKSKKEAIRIAKVIKSRLD
jgi:hypothetical protein